MKIVHVDDQQSYREALQLALHHQAQISVIAHGDSFRPLYALIEEQRPDLVVMDLLVKDCDGISALRELHLRGCSPRTLILTGQNNTAFVGNAFHAGADGYAFKSQSLAELIDAMRTAALGHRYVSPRIPPLPGLEVDAPANPGAPVGLERLSAREREVFCRIIQGHSTRTIASALALSPKTVESHRLRINRKLGMHSPAQLVRFAAISGLMEI